jgi:molecular chaperone DnaK
MAQEIRIQSSGGLSKADIERMVAEAEKYKDQDTARRELIEATNKADSVIGDTEKHMKEYAAELNQTDVDRIKQLIAEVNAKKSTTAQEINTAIDELQSASLKVFDEAIKAARAKKGDAGASSSGSSSSSEPPEAEYTDADRK